MGTVTIQEYTSKNPLQMIGMEAGVCWDANTDDIEKNIKRGKDCVISGHGRTWEFPQVYMIIDGFSARVIRELYTHIGGGPSRLQSSTRYINYEDGFDYVVPHTIENKEHLRARYIASMQAIAKSMKYFEEEGIPKEDCAMLLPLGMATKVVMRTNFRNLVDMSRQRMCTRAYWEFRELFKDIYDTLANYSEEWKWLVENCFMPKCECYGFCTEKNSCGRKPKKAD